MGRRGVRKCAIMNFHEQSRSCHAERSEASRCPSRETLRFAQGDMRGCPRPSAINAAATPLRAGKRASMLTRRFRGWAYKATSLASKERNEGECVVARFIAPGWGRYPRRGCPRPSAINVAATPLRATPLGMINRLLRTQLFPVMEGKEHE